MRSGWSAARRRPDGRAWRRRRWLRRLVSAQAQRQRTCAGQRVPPESHAVDDDALLLAWMALAPDFAALTVEETPGWWRSTNAWARWTARSPFLRQLPAAARRRRQPPGWSGKAWSRPAGAPGVPWPRPSRCSSACAPDGLKCNDAMRLALYLRRNGMPLALRAAAAGGRRPFDNGGTCGPTWPGDRRTCAGRRRAGPLQAEAAYRSGIAIRLRLDADRDDEAVAWPRGCTSTGYAIVFAWLDGIAEQKTPAGLRGLVATLEPAHRQRLGAPPRSWNASAGLWARYGRDRRWRARTIWPHWACGPTMPARRVWPTGGFWSTSGTQGHAAPRAGPRRQRWGGIRPLPRCWPPAGSCWTSRAGRWRSA